MKTPTHFENHPDACSAMDTLSRSSFKKFIEKAKWLLALDRLIQAALPAEFQSRVRVMNVNQGVLILSADSAAVATRVQWMSGELLFQISRDRAFTGIMTIKCKILSSELHKK